MSLKNDPNGEGPLAVKVREHAESVGAVMVPVCARSKAELSELDEADKIEMLADMGMNEPALGKLARAAYNLLGYQSYYTAGEKEVRAWTIPIGCKAPQAAGVIHTDLKKALSASNALVLMILSSTRARRRSKKPARCESKAKATPCTMPMFATSCSMYNNVCVDSLTSRDRKERAC